MNTTDEIFLLPLLEKLKMFWGKTSYFAWKFEFN